MTRWSRLLRDRENDSGVTYNTKLLCMESQTFVVKCGQCADNWPNNPPPIVGTLIREGTWVGWYVWERIGSDLRNQATAANRAAGISGKWKGPVNQPRASQAPMGEELPPTLKVVCRHGHDLRRRSQWVLEQMDLAIESGSSYMLLR